MFCWRVHKFSVMRINFGKSANRTIIILKTGVLLILCSTRTFWTVKAWITKKEVLNSTCPIIAIIASKSISFKHFLSGCALYTVLTFRTHICLTHWCHARSSTIKSSLARLTVINGHEPDFVRISSRRAFTAFSLWCFLTISTFLAECRPHHLLIWTFVTDGTVLAFHLSTFILIGTSSTRFLFFVTETFREISRFCRQRFRWIGRAIVTWPAFTFTIRIFSAFSTIGAGLAFLGSLRVINVYNWRIGSLQAVRGRRAQIRFVCSL